jgi:NAD(P)-dependent dehydrogenase (short-subunit alcohol dehydrogenase family)
MKDHGGGRIINIASQASVTALPGRVAYAASKGGVAQITRTLAWEWAPLGIYVNAVAPSYIDTPMTRDLYKDAEYLKWIQSKTALARVIAPEELVGAVILLASKAGSGITGQLLFVDAGWSAG